MERKIIDKERLVQSFDKSIDRVLEGLNISNKTISKRLSNHLKTLAEQCEVIHEKPEVKKPRRNAKKQASQEVTSKSDNE